jgi:hypothetical protein
MVAWSDSPCIILMKLPSLSGGKYGTYSQKYLSMDASAMAAFSFPDMANPIG